MDLNNIGFLRPYNVGSGGGGGGSLFRNFRLRRIRLVKLNGGREFKVVSHFTASQTTDHRQKGGLLWVAGKEFSCVIGQIPGRAQACYISRHKSYILSKVLLNYKSEMPSDAASCLIRIAAWVSPFLRASARRV